jgi:hypothetical protein
VRRGPKRLSRVTNVLLVPVIVAPSSPAGWIDLAVTVRSTIDDRAIAEAMRLGTSPILAHRCETFLGETVTQLLCQRLSRNAGN